MGGRAEVGRAEVVRCAPYLPVLDVAVTGAYYGERLGFTREYEAGQPPVFAIYSRGAASVMLRRVAGPIVPSEAQGGTWDLFCWVTGLDALFDELAKREVTIVYPPTVQAYGTREFAIRDCDGHVIGFGEPVTGT